MVALEVNTWHYLMGVAEIGSFLMYVISVRVLKGSFDVRFTTSFTFFWKVALITLVTFLPLYLFKLVKHIVAPPSSAKLQD
jgi:phospholipid-translocating ATPase